MSPVAIAIVWGPAALLAATTALFWYTDLDQAAVRHFFSGDAAADIAARFPLGNQQPWKLLYDWGVYPALLLGCGGMIVWVVSFFWLRIKSWRDPGLFFALVLIIGPGILVNCVLKPYWSRPRPAPPSHSGRATILTIRPAILCRFGRKVSAKKIRRFPADTPRWAST